MLIIGLSYIELDESQRTASLEYLTSIIKPKNQNPLFPDYHYTKSPGVSMCRFIWHCLSRHSYGGKEFKKTRVFISVFFQAFALTLIFPFILIHFIFTFIENLLYYPSKVINKIKPSRRTLILSFVSISCLVCSIIGYATVGNAGINLHAALIAFCTFAIMTLYSKIY